MDNPKHISVRLAWHMDGWNGSICRKPEENIYCTGQFSYPGGMYEKKYLQKLEYESGGLSNDINKIINDLIA